MNILNDHEVMNPKFRLLYLLVGFAGLFFLIGDIAVAWPEINAERILYIAVPDMIVFFFAYKTYPMDNDELQPFEPQKHSVEA